MTPPPPISMIPEHADAIRRLRKRVIADVIEIGERLTKCKEICGHGNWLPWLKREFRWSEQTALNYMRVFELSRSKNILDLNLPLTGLYLLAAPSTPERTRDEIIERAEAGETLSIQIISREIMITRAPPPGEDPIEVVEVLEAVASSETEQTPAAGNAVDPEQSATQRMAENAADAADEPPQTSAERPEAGTDNDDDEADANDDDSDDGDDNDLSRHVDAINAANDKEYESYKWWAEDVPRLAHAYADARQQFETHEEFENFLIENECDHHGGVDLLAMLQIAATDEHEDQVREMLEGMGDKAPRLLLAAHPNARGFDSFRFCALHDIWCCLSADWQQRFLRSIGAAFVNEEPQSAENGTQASEIHPPSDGTEPGIPEFLRRGPVGDGR